MTAAAWKPRAAICPARDSVWRPERFRIERNHLRAAAKRRAIISRGGAEARSTQTKRGYYARWSCNRPNARASARKSISLATTVGSFPDLILGDRYLPNSLSLPVGEATHGGVVQPRRLELFDPGAPRDGQTAETTMLAGATSALRWWPPRSWEDRERRRATNSRLVVHCAPAGLETSIATCRAVRNRSPVANLKTVSAAFAAKRSCFAGNFTSFRGHALPLSVH